MVFDFLHAKITKTIGLAAIAISLTINNPVQAEAPWDSAVVHSGPYKTSSGVPVSNCHILTNEHAVRSRDQVIVTLNGTRYHAVVIDRDRKNDLSLLKLSRCVVRKYAKLSKTVPVKGEKVTSVYFKPGGFMDSVTSSSGSFLGYSNIVTEEEKPMLSMVIDDSSPKKGASGGGVMTRNGLVSVIFGIMSFSNRTTAYAVDYYALKDFLHFNNIQG